ncbi:MAG: DNA gyrase inhibitor YacG [Gammaproteobacteria bacterium]
MLCDLKRGLAAIVPPIDSTEKPKIRGVATPCCPTCGKPVTSRQEEAPFCSRRCRLIDLGEWFAGRYRIPSEDSATPRDADDVPP